MMFPISYPSPRVSQLDAYILDSELLSLLKQELVSIFHLHNSKWWTYEQHPELWDLILNLVVFRITTWKTGSSYGLSLQNLKLVNFRNGKTIGFTKRSLLVAVILGDYLFNKFQSYLYSTSDGEAINGGSNDEFNTSILQSFKSYMIRNKDVMLSKINHTLRLLNLANFTLFLVSGRYPSLIHRLLGISLTPVVTDLLRFNGDSVNYEFQNRQLVWNVMTEFLVFILPLLQLKKLRQMSKKLLNPYRKTDSQSDFISPFASLPLSQCAICHYKKDKAVMAGEKKMSSIPCLVTNPYVTNCGHVYCYICLASAFNAMETMEGYEKCFRCGTKLEWFKKYGEDDGDIDQDAIMVEYEEAEDESESDNDYDDDNGENFHDEKTHRDAGGSDQLSDSANDDDEEAESVDEYDDDQVFDEDGGLDDDYEEEYDDDGDEAMEL